MVGYINTVDFAAWHIPCYNTHNCNNGRDRFAGGRDQSDSFVDDGEPRVALAGVGQLALDFSSEFGDEGGGPDADSAAVGAFLFVLLLASVAGEAAVVATLCSRKGYRRPLNVFLLSILLSDLLLVLTAFPMQALLLSSPGGLPERACLSWMYLELTAVASRSWLVPAVVLLYYLHDGLIPVRRLLVVLAWTWISSFLLCLPPLVARDAFLDLETCSVISDGDLAPLVIYVSVVAFFLPAWLLAPAFVAWTGLRSHFNEGGFERSEQDGTDEEELSAEAEEQEDWLGVLPRPSLHLESSSPINRIQDRDFPGVLYTLALCQAFCWSPFFLHLLLTPWMTQSLPQSISVAVAMLGYAQCALTPVLIVLLVGRVSRMLCCCTTK